MAYLQELASHWNDMPFEEQTAAMMEVAHATQGGTNFNSLLIRLAAKSDVQNLSKLFEIYPNLVAASHAMSNGLIPYGAWCATEDAASKRNADKSADANFMQHALVESYEVSSDGYILLGPTEAAVCRAENGSWCNVRLFLPDGS